MRKRKSFFNFPSAFQITFLIFSPAFVAPLTAAATRNQLKLKLSFPGNFAILERYGQRETNQKKRFGNCFAWELDLVPFKVRLYLSYILIFTCCMTKVKNHPTTLFDARDVSDQQ